METSKTKVQSTYNDNSDEPYHQINSNETKSANKTLMYFLLVMTFIMLIVVAVIGIVLGVKLEQVVESPMLMKGMNMYGSNKLRFLQVLL